MRESISHRLRLSSLIAACALLTSCSPVCASRTTIAVPTGLADHPSIHVSAVGCRPGTNVCTVGYLREQRVVDGQTVADVQYGGYQLEVTVHAWADMDSDGRYSVGDLVGETASTTSLLDRGAFGANPRVETPHVTLQRLALADAKPPTS